MVKKNSANQSEPDHGYSQRLLSVKEAAIYLGVSKSLVRQFVSTGKLRRVLIPHPSGYGYVNRLLIDVRDLDGFIERCKESTKA